MINPEDVTIIIPHLGNTSGQEFSLTQCLKSLYETTPQIEVVLAKNGGHKCRHVGEISIPEQGQCKATNLAVASTDTPWIMITNDDMVYSPGWFEKLTADLPEKVLCVSPKLIEPNPGAPTFEVQPFGGAGGDFDKIKWLEFASTYLGQGLRTGFNLPFLIRRDLWDTIGGYDQHYDPWSSNSDSDLEYKIKLAGVQPMQNTNAIVYHFGCTSGTSHPDNRPFWETNWKYFIEKWGMERASSPTIWDATFDIPFGELKYKPEWLNKYA